MWFAWNRDDRIARRDQRCNERDEAQQRRVVRATDTDDTDRLVHREGHAANRDVMHCAVPLVRPGAVGEEAPDTCLDLAICIALRCAGHQRDASSKLGTTRVEISA